MSSFFSQSALHRTNGTFVRGISPVIERLNSTVEEVARTSVPVLIVGESGTGKEAYGRFIHRVSKDRHLPLKKISCRATEQAEFIALKLDLRVRSEDSAQGAQTLFLDDIDELGLEHQKALLSLLPDGQTDEGLSSPPRIIASTSRSLEREIELGRFRKELYFRINGVCVRLPLLKDRKEDIGIFIEHFLAKHAAELDREMPVLTGEERQFLETYQWPGNVRELENLARRIVLLRDFRKAVEELSETPRAETAGGPEVGGFSLKAAARTASRRAERELIARALERTHWNRKRAAQQLQISYKSLLYKIKQTGLEEEQKDGGDV